MFNCRLKNVSIVLFLLISLTLTFGCSKIPGLSSKPSEEQMKSIIAELEKYSFFQNQAEIETYNFEEFKITNEFKKKYNDEDWYCIEVNYKGSYVVKGQEDLDKRTIKMKDREQIRFSFVKKGKDWYGNPGWVE